MSDTTIKDILGNVSFINMGQSPDSIYYNEEGNGLPLIQGNADIKERKSIKRFFTSQITKVCDEGDILMTVRAPVGYVGVASFQSCVGRGVCSIKANGVDTKYLFYLLIQNEDKWKAFEAGTTFSAVTSKEVYNFPLLLTKSKTEQRQIARILSTADAVIEKTQAAIAKYKAIKQGMLQDLFTRGIDLNSNKLRPRFEDAPELYKESKLGLIPREWDEEVLGNLVSSYSGGTPSRGIESYYKGDIPWVTSSEVNQDEIFKTNQHITQDALDNSSAKWVESNTVLVAMYGATAGQISMLRIRATTNQAVLACPSLGEISTDFLYYLMVFNKDNLLNKTQGTGQPNLSKSIIDALDVVFPKPNEQQKIAERLKAIDNKLQTEQTYLLKMQNLKKGLMEDLLSGKKQVKVAEEVLTQSEN